MSRAHLFDTMDNTHQILEGAVFGKATAAEHQENVAKTQSAFDRPHFVSPEAGRSRRNSLGKGFDDANMAMTLPDKTHLEIFDDPAAEDNTIDDIAPGWFVWLVAATASIAGSLFGCETPQRNREDSYGPSLTFAQTTQG